jgi:8-oxo-dGTP pyrophosphatase MutT (NUDIX family)
MIAFDSEAGRFTYRAAGIALHNEHVLLQHAARGGAWFLPGGRVELQESTQETLLREMREELQIDAHVERLLWVNEHFFVQRRKLWHELAFYYLMKLPPSFVQRSWTTPIACQEQTTLFLFEWVALDTLVSIELYPTFLRERLAVLPATVEHIIDADDEYIRMRSPFVADADSC